MWSICTIFSSAQPLLGPYQRPYEQSSNETYEEHKKRTSNLVKTAMSHAESKVYSSAEVLVFIAILLQIAREHFFSYTVQTAPPLAVFNDLQISFFRQNGRCEKISCEKISSRRNFLSQFKHGREGMIKQLKVESRHKYLQSYIFLSKVLFHYESTTKKIIIVNTDGSFSMICWFEWS